MISSCRQSRFEDFNYHIVMLISCFFEWVSALYFAIILCSINLTLISMCYFLGFWQDVCTGAQQSSSGWLSGEKCHGQLSGDLHYLENAISINPKNATHHYMVCSSPPGPLFMNFGGGSFFEISSRLGP